MTTNLKRSTSSRSNAGTDLKPMFLLIGLWLVLLTAFIAFSIKSLNLKLIPLSVIPLVLGLVFEGKRIIEKWSTFFYLFLFSFILSYSSFIPGKYEHVYNIENHIKSWPYYFIGFFAILSLAFNKDKITPKLTEGITFLQSISFIYWIVDYNLFDSEKLIIKVLLILGFIFSLYSLVNAFTNLNLSKSNRLILSIWSSVIMLFFSIENIYSVYQNKQIESAINFAEGLYIALQYFLLGICTIYMLQNFLMLSGFLPGKGTFFNKQYFEDIRELKYDHISRYSEFQVKKLHSLFCLIFSVIFYSINHYFKLLPSNIAIWIVFLIFPYLIYFSKYLTINKSKNR